MHTFKTNNISTSWTETTPSHTRMALSLEWTPLLIENTISTSRDWKMWSWAPRCGDTKTDSPWPWAVKWVTSKDGRQNISATSTPSRDTCTKTVPPGGKNMATGSLCHLAEEITLHTRASESLIPLEDPSRPQEGQPCDDFYARLTAVCRHDKRNKQKPVQDLQSYRFNGKSMFLCPDTRHYHVLRNVTGVSAGLNSHT
jgi:hypothetical protein